jgi:hypothetical protein
MAEIKQSWLVASPKLQENLPPEYTNSEEEELRACVSL